MWLITSIRLPPFVATLATLVGLRSFARAMCEFIRVLKPGGLLVVSVPFGNRFVEQQRVGFAGAARRTGDQEHYFFQRIYDRGAFESRIVAPAQGLTLVSVRY